MSTSASTRVRRSHGAAAKLAGLTVALAIVATTAASASAASARATARDTATTVAVPKLVWTDCGDGFQCAKAKVPLDYSVPQRETIKLALIRLPASDPSHRIGSIFLNPGGPGGSGVDMVRGAGKFLYSNAVRARFDLVGFDPRGIRRSAPVRCFDNQDEAEAVVAPMAFPYTTAEEHVWERSDQLLANACTKHAGAIIDHMSTANVARDLDLLRQAVGDEKLTYAGYSYGSYIGSTYANMFPGNVRALIVDGVLDPVAWSTGYGSDWVRHPFSTREHSDASAQPTLEQFFVLCDQGGDNCAFSGDSKARYFNLTQRLLEHPLVLPDGSTITYADVVGLTLNVLYDPPLWPRLAKNLAQVEAALGDPAAAAAAGASVQDLRAQLRGYDNYPNFVEGAPSVFCADSDNPLEQRAWRDSAHENDNFSDWYFGRPWTWISSICAVWPGVDQDRYMGPFDHTTANPVLIIGNFYDPATSYQGAVTLANTLPRSRLLTLDGWGHTSAFLSTCIDNYVDQYLLTQALPPKKTVCRPDIVPFADPPATSSAAGASSPRAAVVGPNLPLAVRGGTSE